MRVLVLSGATYADPNRRVLLDRVADRDVEIVLAMPRQIRYLFFPSEEVPDTPWPTPGVRLEKLTAWRSHENDTHIVLKDVSGLIARVRPDVIHCVMEPWSVVCLQALAAMPRPPRGPVFGVHPCESKPEQGKVPARSIRRILYHYVISRCQYFVGWSEPTMRAAIRMGLNGQITSTSPAVGVDTDLFRPRMPDERHRARVRHGFADAGEFMVGYIGRFVVEKGVLDLLAAMDSVVKERPRAALVLVGAGPLEAELRGAALSRPWLRIVGRQDSAGISDLMGALDLLALPSRTTALWEEQFGLVLSEAMASGIPVIGSTCGAIPEVVGDAGWIVGEGDPPALGQCILRALDDEAGRVARGARGRERAVTRFSNEAIAEVLVRTWQAALNRRRP